MAESERANLVRQIRRARLAQNDLRQVVAAAVHLSKEQLDGDLVER